MDDVVTECADARAGEIAEHARIRRQQQEQKEPPGVTGLQEECKAEEEEGEVFEF